MKGGYRVLIVDDDPGVRRMLAKIIEEEELALVIGEAENGVEAVELAFDLDPDLIMIDLLMPELDGIETIKKLKSKGFSGSFILLSKITDKMMVREAYQAGVEFYIHKPINRDEVCSVVEKILRYQGMEKTFKGIQSFLNNQQSSSVIEHIQKTVTHSKADSAQKARVVAENIVMDLGILSQSGSNDILEAMEILSGLKDNEDIKLLQNLKVLYQKIGESYNNKGVVDIASGEKAIERRIRRTVEYALNNLANLGIEDYYHPKFERFAHRLFDFSTIREEMQRIQKKTDKRPKLNVKRFLEGLLREIKQEETGIFR